MSDIPLVTTLDPSSVPSRVRVHRNLNKRGPNGEAVWSVVDPSTGLVLLHAHRVALVNVRMRVQTGGRERVLAEQRKNVHAYIEGVPAVFDGVCSREVTYNPYRAAYFYDVETGIPVWDAERATLDVEGAAVDRPGWDNT